MKVLVWIFMNNLGSSWSIRSKLSKQFRHIKNINSKYSINIRKEKLAQLGNKSWEFKIILKSFLAISCGLNIGTYIRRYQPEGKRVAHACIIIETVKIYAAYRQNEKATVRLIYVPVSRNMVSMPDQAENTCIGIRNSDFIEILNLERLGIGRFYYSKFGFCLLLTKIWNQYDNVL